LSGKRIDYFYATISVSLNLKKTGIFGTDFAYFITKRAGQATERAYVSQTLRLRVRP
jgi:hypothetical protein